MANNNRVRNDHQTCASTPASPNTHKRISHLELPSRQRSPVDLVPLQTLSPTPSHPPRKPQRPRPAPQQPTRNVHPASRPPDSPPDPGYPFGGRYGQRRARQPAHGQPELLRPARVRAVGRSGGGRQGQENAGVGCCRLGAHRDHRLVRWDHGC